MPKFPVDAPRTRVVRALAALGFRVVREREHIAMMMIGGGVRRQETIVLANPFNG